MLQWLVSGHSFSTQLYIKPLPVCYNNYTLILLVFFSPFCNKNASFIPGSRCEIAGSGSYVGTSDCSHGHGAFCCILPSKNGLLFAVCTCKPQQCTRATYWQITAPFPRLVRKPRGKIPNLELQISPFSTKNQKGLQ